MPVIIKRPLARSDLTEIWDYIADDNETRADAFIDSIDQKFETLAVTLPWAVLVTNWQKVWGAFRYWQACHFLPSHIRRCRDRPRTARFTRPERYFQS